jgi:SAM-dependent methyltransferase
MLTPDWEKRYRDEQKNGWIGDSRRRELDWFQFLSQADEGRGKRDEYNPREKHHEFHYIRYPIAQFGRIITPHMKRARTFIDVGCGGGDKLACVRENWPDVDVFGVEHDPAMASWASMFGTVYCEDALLVNYNRYDVIYAYWPICNLDLMNDLCHRVMKTKRKKAPFILVGCPYITNDQGTYDHKTRETVKYSASHYAWKGGTKFQQPYWARS